MATINSAQKVNDPITEAYCSIKADIDGVEMFVSLDVSNKERMMVQAWEDAGNTIADAD